MKYFATCCTHFGHKNIINLANRPFTSVDEMDEALINNWNKVVSPADVVFHLGDVSWYGFDDTYDIFDRLNGEKVLIKGNHDMTWIHDLNWTDCHEYLETKILGKNFVFFHFPIADWNGRFRGSIHVHGHIHNQVEIAPPMTNRHNVCVEVTNYTPVDLSTFI